MLSTPNVQDGLHLSACSFFLGGLQCAFSYEFESICLIVRHPPLSIGTEKVKNQVVKPTAQHKELEELLGHLK
ncbi:hypothetical protein LEMLEM_LOCUS23842 [Lemmus lemmus]